jgi:hypothetical protein
MLTLVAKAESPVQAGLWEMSEKVAIEGAAEMPSPPRQVCLKSGEANLEKMLLPPPDEAAAHGCKAESAQTSAGVMTLNIACPATDTDPGVNATAEIKYTPTTYEGVGKAEMKAKDGKGAKGPSKLSGKRIGDC